MTITVTNISKHDTASRRYNNYDAREGLLRNGVDSKFLSWTPALGNPTYSQQVHSERGRSLTPLLAKLGRKTGNLNGYYRNANAFIGAPFYQEADLLHYHIVHDAFLSIHDWLKIAKNKPVVWTWHDPYMLHGHCIYSLDCNLYETGCQKCPHLDYYFPIERDRSAKNLQEKIAAIEKIDPLVIVASEHMRELVERSRYPKSLRVKQIPFGIDLPIIKSQDEAKAALGIPLENTVIGFRAIPSTFKGVDIILSALRELSRRYPKLPLTVITFEHIDYCKDMSPYWQIIDAGWVHGSEIATYYSAMDYFMMPSRAEAFGMMGIESMASGAIPLVTYGTALSSLVAAPTLGLATKHHPDDYFHLLEQVIMTKHANLELRSRCVEFAKERYSLEHFCKNMAAAYQEEIAYFSQRNR
jgi:glycosyltransferase involved in cell wall biosynthesis